MRAIAFGLLFLLCTALQAAPQNAEVFFYRYIDSRGVTVIDRQGVPPEYVAKGYEILNQQGRVVHSVPPAPTAEERRLRQEKQLKANADAQLLNSYPSLDELDRARARQLSELDNFIAMAKNTIQALQSQQAGVQRQAADQERAGHEVPQALLDQLKDLRDQRAEQQRRILGYQQARAKVDQDFASQRARLEQLLGNSGS